MLERAEARDAVGAGGSVRATAALAGKGESVRCRCCFRRAWPPCPGQVVKTAREPFAGFCSPTVVPARARAPAAPPASTSTLGGFCDRGATRERDVPAAPHSGSESAAGRGSAKGFRRGGAEAVW